MSGSGTPKAPPEGPGADPSMEDILASIRRILNEDEAAAAQPPVRREDVLVLDGSMMVSDPKPAAAAAPPAPISPPAVEPALAALPETGSAGAERLVAPAAAAAAAASVGNLVRTLASERGTAVHRGGPTLEDLVREELRPLLKAWLDANLPPLVERLVRSEIERVLGRSAS